MVKYQRYLREDWRGSTLPVVEGGGSAVSLSVWGLSLRNRPEVVRTPLDCSPSLKIFRIRDEKVFEKIGYISNPLQYLYCLVIFQYSQGGFRFITNRIKEIKPFYFKFRQSADKIDSTRGIGNINYFWIVHICWFMTLSLAVQEWKYKETFLALFSESLFPVLLCIWIIFLKSRL